MNKCSDSGCCRISPFSQIHCLCVQLNPCVLERASVCVYARATVTNKAKCVCESSCVYPCLYVCAQAALSPTSPLHFYFFFFYRQRACLLSLSGACPSSAASYRVLWELCDPRAISIHVFVKLFSIEKSPFVWLRTLGWVLLWQGVPSEERGFSAWSA